MKSFNKYVLIDLLLFDYRIHSVNMKFGTKFIVALCDVFWKIARTGRFYFEKCHPVTYSGEHGISHTLDISLT
jgi:hypothetical protein